ncbi:related to GYP1-GTPase activating protein [Ustilago bromivora]|uniref:Related to GYP1 - GTPase activating protein n=1 Tax=Ustilago bromivora TaxID=307758 RepID=A0A1K0GBQ3_9BASI|nr:related to GYP1-GTPase activating protein [Ustilago bromivora]SYW82893.1 related to GYP1 - GTPase activating protein [Ustilago bromivora]
MRGASGTGSGRRGGDFDDQAWGIESDDEDFVSQIAPRTNVPRSLKSSSRSSSYSFTQQQSSLRPQQLRSQPSSSSSASASASASNSAAASIPRRDSRDGSASWTVVNRQVSSSAAKESLDHTPIAGSPPTDLADAVAAGLDLDPSTNITGECGSGFQLVDDEPTVVTANASGSETEEVDLDTGKTVRRKRPPGVARKPSSGTAEAETLRQSLWSDLDQLVRDPAHALTRLAAEWSSSSPRPSPTTDEASDVAQTLTTTSKLGVAPTPTAREFTFDPIAAAGDGLIITGPSFVDATAGHRGLSTSSSAASPLTSVDVSFSNDAHSIADGDAADGGSKCPDATGELSRKRSVRSSRRRQQLLNCLSKQSVDIAQLRTLAWAGVPDELRPMVWQLLLGYLPAVASVRASTLSRKRAEYAAGVELAFAKGIAALDQAIWHQIHIDVPRTNPGIRLWQRQATQRSLERILYVWAIRHPASGYVQGINDLATPFFEVFLSSYIRSDPEMFDIALLPANVLEAIEADTFWCLSKLLDGIQDNYIFAQPGIQRQVRRLGELVARIDAPLHAHLQEQGVEYMQFAFRWMNCLLMREMSVRNIIRMWDTYLAEGPDAFSDFHLYVCSVFLHKWTDKLRTMDFQGIIMFLQSLPTQSWSDKDAEMLLSEAFMYKTLFGNTAHLNK